MVLDYFSKSITGESSRHEDALLSRRAHNISQSIYMEVGKCLRFW